MIITRTPFRISFFGGGTDIPLWYRSHGGAVLSTTINKYLYINCRKLPPFFDYRHRIVYSSKSEYVNHIDEIEHPSVREAFRLMGITEGMDLHYDSDLPARSGLGSSSSFTVGLLHALYAYRGQIVSKKRLAEDAIYVEQEMIKEAVGSQDQVAAAFGGFNEVHFREDGAIQVSPITIGTSRVQELQNHLALFFTGFQRNAYEIESEKVKNFSQKEKELNSIQSFVNEAIAILNGGNDITDFGRLLHESWKYKKNLSKQVSNQIIDDIYMVALQAGAIGGKILGAGGGGFILFFVSPQHKQKLIRELKLLHVPFRFESSGSQIIYYKDEEMYSEDD